MSITPTQEAPRVDPLPGWVLECEHGYQAKDSTPDGRLVRLATVVQWLQESQRLPRANAVDELCTKLDERALGDLYSIQSGAFAVPVPKDWRFGFKASKPVQMSAQLHGVPHFVRPKNHDLRKIFSTNAPVPPQPVAVSGLPALLARLRSDWRARPALKQGACDPLDDKRTLSAFLALPIGLAHELWGWGQLHAAPAVDAEPLEAARPAPALEPDPFAGIADELRGRLDELIKQRGKGTRQEGKKGNTKWSDSQRVTAADVVDAVNKLRPRTGVKALADKLGVSVQTLSGTRGVLEREAVRKSRDVMRTEDTKRISHNANIFSLADAAKKTT